MSLFKYAPFQDPGRQIRLLELHLDTEDSSLLACSLATWQIEDAPDYVAISYTWGDPSSMCTISLNGIPIEVRSTCFDALNQVGRHRKRRYYWLDALCIDQDNLHEKAEQVAIMADIFGKADRVAAYVGPTAGDSNNLMQFLSYLTSKRCSLAEMYGWTGWSGTTCWTLYLSGCLARANEIWFGYLIRSLMQFSARPWFSRLWVAQEIFVAKEIDLCCGDKIVDMMELEYLLATRPFSLILMLHKHGVRTTFELEWLQKLVTCYGTDILQSQMRKLWDNDVAFKPREWDDFVLDPGLHHLMVVIQLARRADRTPQRVGVRDSNTPAIFPYFGARFISEFEKDPEHTGGIDAVQSLVNDLHCQDPRDKIFGTLRFVDPTYLAALRPDYTVTRFDLAVKVIRLYATGQKTSGKCFRLAEDLVRNLKLDLDTSEIKRGLLKRRNCKYAGTNVEPCNEKYILQERSCHSSRLIATKSGVLSALLQIDMCPDKDRRRGLWNELDWKPLVDRCQPLFVFGDMCGLVTSAARPGDYLVQLHGELDPRATLVVRRSSVGQHRPKIVGLAQLGPGVRTCVDPYEGHCHCFRTFDFRFSEEDLLVLAARHVAVMDGFPISREHLELLNIEICEIPHSSLVDGERALSEDLNDRKAEARHERVLFERLKMYSQRLVPTSFDRHLRHQLARELVLGQRTIPGRERQLASAFAPLRILFPMRHDDSNEELTSSETLEDLFDFSNILQPGSDFMRKIERETQDFLQPFL